jgi:thiamine biosynthesis lipoprotein
VEAAGSRATVSKRLLDAVEAGLAAACQTDGAVASTASAGLRMLGDDHHARLDAAGQTVVLTARGVATSSTVRSWRADGEVLRYVIDPATGRPTGGPWRTISLAAARCVDANTAPTAALVQGAAAQSWLTEAGLPARLVAVNGQVRAVPGWPSEPL